MSVNLSQSIYIILFRIYLHRLFLVRLEQIRELSLFCNHTWTRDEDDKYIAYYPSMQVSKLSFSYPVYACIQSIYIVFFRIYLHRLFLVSFEQMGELALLPVRREDDQHIYLSI